MTKLIILILLYHIVLHSITTHVFYITAYFTKKNIYCNMTLEYTIIEYIIIKSTAPD